MTQTPSGLKEILRIEVEAPVQWIAGETAADIPVNWFTCSIEDINEGDVLLAKAEECSTHLLDLAGKNLAAGVLLLGESKPSPK